MAGFSSLDPCIGTLLQGTSALQCKAGIIGGAAGAAADTMLCGVYIQLTATTATTLSIAGMLDSSGAAQPMLISGQITSDVYWAPVEPILNNRGAFVFTPSAAAKVWVFTRPYNGPEAPGIRVTD